MKAAGPSAGETSLDMSKRVNYIVLALAVAIILLAAAFILILRPYSRLERMAADAIRSHAPQGTTAGDISISFPLKIVMTNLTVPVRMQGRQQKIDVEELNGRISILSLFGGQLELGMNSDFFGGTLWLDVTAKPSSASTGGPMSRLGFDARARGLDAAKLNEFFGSDIDLSGVCDADIEGELTGDDLASLDGRALAMGRDIYVSPIDIESIILPANQGVEFTSGFSSNDGKITVDRFQVTGSAYNLSGDGTIRLSNPPDRSALDCSFRVVFKEAPIIKDESLADMGAEYVFDALVEKGAEVHFKLSGTPHEPQLEFDPSSSIGSLLRKSSR